jgi:hypothetical protein
MITDLEDLYSITNLLDFAGQQTQRGLAFAWRQSRTRKRYRCQGSGGGLGTDTALVFWTRATVSSYLMQRECDVCESVCEAHILKSPLYSNFTGNILGP